MPKSKRNTHRIGGAHDIPTRKVSTPLPLLFDLPGELREVRGLAFWQAMENAFQVKKQHLHLDEMGARAAAIEAALLWEKQELNGAKGTNDPQLFRSTFEQFYLRIYPAMMNLFEQKPFAFTVLNALTEKKRVAWLQAFAQQHILQMEQVPLDEPIEIEW